VVEDDPPVRQACAEIADTLGLVAETADSLAAARRALGKGPVDIVLLDLNLGNEDGLLLLDELRLRHPAAVVVLMTAFVSVASAVEGLRAGASDYLAKPFTIEELSAALERAAQRRSFDAEARQLRERLRTGRGMGSLVGRSPAMEKIYRILSKVAFTAHPVLIVGESGTGKELMARTIHLNGPNATKPFLPVDCGWLDPNLLEAELFGRIGQSTAGTHCAETGVLASVEGATVFLDEVGEMPLELQGKLLRALQQKEVRPASGGEPVPLTARVLAASSRDLSAMVDAGRFRKDLFYRLNVVKLQIPPLRERRQDIPLLAAHMLELLVPQTEEPYTLGADTVQLLMEHDWPGNVRELQHAIERACALSSGPVLHLGDMPTQLQDVRLHRGAEMHPSLSRTGAGEGLGPGPGSAGDLPTRVLSIAEMEKNAILNTLRQLKGDKLMTAKLLGIGKTTLYRKLKEYGLADDDD
jgi:two-component system response regulator HydG